MLNHNQSLGLLVLFCLLTTAVSFAADVAAVACTSAPIQSKDKMYVLNSNAKATHGKVFLIQNISKASVWVTHPQNNDAGVGAGWASTLKAGNWSALLLSKRDFTLTCTAMSADNPVDLDCTKVLKVCEANVSDQSKASMSYWLGEDQSWGQLVNTVIAKLKLL